MVSWIYVVTVAAILSMDASLASLDQHDLVAQLKEYQLKVSHLESGLDEITTNLEARKSRLQACEKQVMDMDDKILQLQSSLSELKGDSSSSIQNIKALEEEVRDLWAASRKNNFDLHVLESEVQEAEEKAEVLSSQVEKFADIVAEQWIQIQQFEQALQLRQMRIMRIQEQVKPQKCPFLKFTNDFARKYVPKALNSSGGLLFGKEVSLRPQMAQATHHLTRFCLAIKEFHHKVQHSVKLEMQRYDLIASFANNELVFVVASALILFPAFGAWTLLSSWLPSL